MKRFVPVLLLLAAAACSDNSTSPSVTLGLPPGQYVLRILASSGSCATAGLTAVPIPSAFALVTLARGGSEWVARATGEAGDLEMRFHETRIVRDGANIEGSFRGTLANMAAAGGIATSDTRASFGGDGAVVLSGIALVGPFNTSIINGEARGTIRFSDGSGRACSADGAFWALQFVQ